jgi:hypothetical protein
MTNLAQLSDEVRETIEWLNPNMVLLLDNLGHGFHGVLADSVEGAEEREKLVVHG